MSRYYGVDGGLGEKTPHFLSFLMGGQGCDEAPYLGLLGRLGNRKKDV